MQGPILRTEDIIYRLVKGVEISSEDYDKSLKALVDGILSLQPTTNLTTFSDAWPIGGMQIRAYATNYPILTDYYNAPVTNIQAQTLNESTGDENYSTNNPTHIRRDAVVADIQGNILILQGVPGVISVVPTVDTNIYFFIRDIIITAADIVVDGETGTAPTVVKTLYKVNSGEPNEANATSSNASINPDSDNLPITTPKSIEATNPQRRHKTILSFTSTQTTTGATHLRLKNKLKAVLPYGYWFLGFYKDGVRVSQSLKGGWYVFRDGEHGFDASNDSDNQELLISLKAAGAENIEYDKVELYLYHNSTVIPGYWLDDIELITGVADNPYNPPSESHYHDNKDVLDQITQALIDSINSVNASGFDGNLEPTDDTLQKVAQKVDDFVLSGVPEPSILHSSETTPTDLLVIPTYDNDLSVVHPDVYYNSKGWNNYKYWMAFMPYPDSDREQPSVVCSNDGKNWIVPNGLTNPIYTRQMAIDLGHTVISDTDLLEMPDGRLMMISRCSGGIGEGIYRGYSEFGYDWTDLEQIFLSSGTSRSMLSPALVYHSDTELRMYYINRGVDSAGNELKYRVSTDNGDTWGAEISAPTPSDVGSIWHVDVLKTTDGYHLLTSKETKDQNVSEVYPSELYHMRSNDGVTWEWGYGNIEKYNDGDDDNGFYRSTFIAKTGNKVTFDLFLNVIGTGVSPLTDSEWRVQLRKNIDLNKKVIENEKTSSFSLTNFMQDRIVPIDNGSSAVTVSLDKVSLRRDFTCSGVVYGSGVVSFSGTNGATISYPNTDTQVTSADSTFFIIRKDNQFKVYINNIV